MKIQIIEKLFFNILTYSYLLLPITVFFYLNKNKRTESVVLGLYGILFCLLLFLIEHSFIPKAYIKFYQSLYTLSEYSFFSYFLYKSITVKSFKLVILCFSFLFLLFLFYDYYWVGESKVDSIPVGVETILIFIYISFFFYQSFRGTIDEYIYNHHCFWFAVGMLIYLGGTFFFNILVNHVDQAQIDKYWFLTYIAEIIKNFLFCIAVVVSIRNPHNEKRLQHKSIPFLDLDMN